MTHGKLKIESLLQKVELGSTLRNMLPQLATLQLTFFRDKLRAKVVIRATMLFNLQCNNVGRQVLLGLYYLAFVTNTILFFVHKCIKERFAFSPG